MIETNQIDNELTFYEYDKPIKRDIVSANLEVLQMLKDPINNFRSYPRSLTTDEQRFKCLKKWFDTKDVTPEVFLELASVLEIKNKDEKLVSILEVVR